MDLIDGYEELPKEWQTKVKRALEQGHVDDEDWAGDVECNRPGQKGYRTKETKAAQRAAAKVRGLFSMTPDAPLSGKPRTLLIITTG